jgi:hypothetical protein
VGRKRNPRIGPHRGRRTAIIGAEYRRHRRTLIIGFGRFCRPAKCEFRRLPRGPWRFSKPTRNRAIGGFQAGQGPRADLGPGGRATVALPRASGPVSLQTRVARASGPRGYFRHFRKTARPMPKSTDDNRTPRRRRDRAYPAIGVWQQAGSGDMPGSIECPLQACKSDEPYDSPSFLSLGLGRALGRAADF